MTSCAVIIPIYKSQLTDFERRNIRISLTNLNLSDLYLVSPENLNIDKNILELGPFKSIKFSDDNFTSISSYSRLMLSKKFFNRFENYSHILICQPDAVILKPELNYWINQPYDYLGAPWPDGFELVLKTKHIPLTEGIKCKAYVGNGGLSLRRIKSCLDLFEEYDDIHREWINWGHAEDLFFGLAGYLSKYFRLPNVYTAAHFSHETQADYLFKLIGNKLPFGAHGFDKYPNQNIEEYLSMQYF